MTDQDLELIYHPNQKRSSMKILPDDEEMEYIITTPEHPLIIFIPTELTMNEYKNYMTVALTSIDAYKRK